MSNFLQRNHKTFGKIANFLEKIFVPVEILGYLWFLFIPFFIMVFIFFNKNIGQPDLNLVELKTFENFEVATSSKANVALYKKEFLDSSGKAQEMFLTLGEMKDDKAVVREGLQKLHTNIFWDPNRCAQMLNIIGNDAIVFSDTFKNVEGEGFTTFVYMYDIKKNALVGYKVFVSIQKLFTDGNHFYGISKKQNIWTLYKINFETKKLEEIKAYSHSLQLITAANELKWCDGTSKECIEENAYNFIAQNINLTKEVDPENSLNLKVFFENKKIFELKKEDLIGYYILGIR